MCGILAVYNKEHSSVLSFIKALSQLQHRGNESYGIVYQKPSLNSIKISHFKGTVSPNDLPHENYKIALGHVRYSTVKKTDNSQEHQPMYSNKHNFYLVHNGNIPKYNDRYEGSDTSYIVDQINKYSSVEEGLKQLIKTLPGVYSIILLHNNSLYVARDVYGVRPLVVAGSSTALTVTSETVSLQPQDRILFEVEPGAVVKIGSKIEYLYQHHPTPKQIYCSFEIIYFMHHLSKIGDTSISELRYRLGEILAKKEEKPIKDAIVVAMPNTAIPGAQGFANALQLPYFPYIMKSKEATRTFILPTNRERQIACSKKFLFHTDLKDKIVYVVDDSIVRGNTLTATISSLREVGVKEVHLRITSPPVISSCYYGIDIPTYEELIAHNKTIPEVCDQLGADSLSYLTTDELKEAMGSRICTACFDDKHHKELLDW